MKRQNNLYEQIYEWNNLLLAFYKTVKGKRNRRIPYEQNLYRNLKNLQMQLQCEQLQLESYRFFKIFDPKERKISVAPFSVRVLHHAIINITEPIFENFQIYDNIEYRM